MLDERMRVLIAPDKFAGTLTAVEAAEAIAQGWRRRAPGGELLAVTVRGPLGGDVPGSVLLVDGTAYVESAQACGLHLVSASDRRPEDATTYGVGQLVRAGVEAGAE